MGSGRTCYLSLGSQVRVPSGEAVRTMQSKSRQGKEMQTGTILSCWSEVWGIRAPKLGQWDRRKSLPSSHLVAEVTWVVGWGGQ